MNARVLTVGALWGALAAPAAAAELAVQFEGLDGRGQVSVAVFRSAESWNRRADAAWAQVRPLAAGEARIIVELPPGDYAVMAYHDRNANGRLDTLPIGLPTETYGFSNDSRAVFGPPPWSAARFTLPAGGARQVIRLR